MTDTITESFCERCGTRYSFAKPAKRRRVGLGSVRVLSRGLKNYVVNDGLPMDEAMAAARDEEGRSGTARQLDAFHKAFNFCMTCRQYTCGNCWNGRAGECLTCAPDLTREVLPAPFPDIPVGPPDETGTERDIAEPMAWPRVDLDRASRVAAPEGEVASAADEGVGPTTEEPDVLARLDAFVVAPTAAAPTRAVAEELTAEELAEIESALASTPSVAGVTAARVNAATNSTDVAEATEELAGGDLAAEIAEPAEAAPQIELIADEPGAVAESVELEGGEPAIAAESEAAAETPAEVEAAAEPAAAETPAEAEAEAAAETPAEVEAAAEPPAETPAEVASEAEAAADIPAEAEAAAEPPAAEAAAEIPAEAEAGLAAAETPAEAEAEPATADPPAAPDSPAEAEGEAPAGAEPVTVEPVAAEVPAEAEAEPVTASDRATVARGQTRSLLGRFRPARPAGAAPGLEPVSVVPAAAAPEPQPAAAERTPEAPDIPLTPDTIAAERAPRQGPADTIEQPAWRIVAPDTASAPTPIWPDAPEWPTNPQVPAPPSAPGAAPGPGAAPWASRLATSRPEPIGVWAASSEEVLGGPAGPRPATQGAPAVQACVSCGLSLSANARFCRRCGTRQT